MSSNSNMDSKSLFLGIDIGTQSTRCVLINQDCKIIAESSIDSSLVITEEGYAYEDSNDIFNNTIKVIKSTLSQTNINKDEIKSIAIDSQMAGILAIDSNFDPVGPYDSWLDNRCSKYSDSVSRKDVDKYIQLSGGQLTNSHILRIIWRKNERPQEYQKIAKFIQPSSFVAGKLAGLKASDAFVDSSYTHFDLFSNLENNAYNKEAFDKYDLDFSKMPKIVSPNSIIGTITEQFATLLGINKDTKIVAGCGDTTASALGAGIVKQNLAYDVAGTASVFACSTKEFKPDFKHKTLLYSKSVIDGLYLPLSYVSGGGLCIRWFANLVNESYEVLTNEASSVNNEHMKDLLFIPHFNGRSYPQDPNLTGCFLGLNQSTTRGEMFKAILESIAFEYRIYLDILKEEKAIDSLTNIIGVGGGAKNPLFCQIKADVLGSNYSAMKKVESASFACAVLAGKSIGLIKDSYDELFKNDKSDSVIYSPNISRKSYYEEKYKKYIKLVNSYSQYIK